MEKKIPTEEELAEVGQEILNCARFDDLETLSEIIDELKKVYPDYVKGLLNYQDKTTGNTAIHYCAANNSRKVLEFILSIKVPLQHIENSLGNTPLLWAVQGGHLDVVRTILKSEKLKTEVDVLQKNKEGKSCITYSFDSTAPSSKDILNLILEHPTAKALEETHPKDEDLPEQLTRLSLENKNNEFTHEVTFPNMGCCLIRELPNLVNKEEKNSLDETGVNLWAASLILTRWLLTKEFSTKKLLELGAGCALPSIVLSQVASIIATETKTFPKTFENMVFNCQSNSVKYAELDWVEPHNIDTFIKESVDTLIGSDLVYDHTLVAPLLNIILSLAKACKKKGQTVFTFYYVTIERNRQGFDYLKVALESAGFESISKSCPKDYKLGLKSVFGKLSHPIFDIHFNELLTEDFKLHTFQYK
eukprot:maker-scaffold_2-snap-gene-25.61-mRNA-1 protein AED:0.00 eAED:0.00 QI:91/1/1/1/1/1/2/163/418